MTIHPHLFICLHTSLDSIAFTYENKYLNLPSKCSRSLDGFPALFCNQLQIQLLFLLLFVLKLLYPQVAYPKSGKLPNYVCPSFKKGIPSHPSNYRPISQTSITEHIISDSVLNFFKTYKLISTDQFGFMQTCTQLLATLNDWTWYVNVNKCFKIDTVYVDFAKTFDTVPHVYQACWIWFRTQLNKVDGLPS